MNKSRDRMRSDVAAMLHGLTNMSTDQGDLGRHAVEVQRIQAILTSMQTLALLDIADLLTEPHLR